MVLDIDVDHGGQKSYEKLVIKNGPTNGMLVARTGGGGWHLMWRWRDAIKNAVNVRPGLDVRSSGGYIVAPPSMHVSGERYRWHHENHPAKMQMERVHGWVRELMNENSVEKKPKPKVGTFDPSKPKPRIDINSERPIADGGRNHGLFKLACRFVWEDQDDKEVEQSVFEANRKLCSPPLPAGEVYKIIRSALNYRGR